MRADEPMPGDIGIGRVGLPAFVLDVDRRVGDARFGRQRLDLRPQRAGRQRRELVEQRVYDERRKEDAEGDQGD